MPKVTLQINTHYEASFSADVRSVEEAEDFAEQNLAEIMEEIDRLQIEPLISLYISHQDGELLRERLTLDELVAMQDAKGGIMARVQLSLEELAKGLCAREGDYHTRLSELISLRLTGTPLLNRVTYTPMLCHDGLICLLVTADASVAIKALSSQDAPEDDEASLIPLQMEEALYSYDPLGD